MQPASAMRVVGVWMCVLGGLRLREKYWWYVVFLSWAVVVGGKPGGKRRGVVLTAVPCGAGAQHSTGQLHCGHHHRAIYGLTMATTCRDDT